MTLLGWLAMGASAAVCFGVFLLVGTSERAKKEAERQAAKRRERRLRNYWQEGPWE